MKHKRLSISELLLLLLYSASYLAALYFLLKNDRFLFLLFFILQSCSALVIYLLILTGREAVHVTNRELSYEKAELKQKLETRSEQLKKLRAEKERAAAELDRQEKALAKAGGEDALLRKDLEQARRRLAEYEELFPTGPGEKQLPLFCLLPAADQPGRCQDAAAQAEEVLAQLRPSALQKGILLTLQRPEAAVSADIDSRRFKLMLYSIVENAVKYMGRPGSVVVTLSAVGDGLFIVIRDDGKGMEEAEVSHIFELNYQGSNRQGGSGLGLAQAKAIVARCGGRISAASSPGNGMAAQILLPAGKKGENEE